MKDFMQLWFGVAVGVIAFSSNSWFIAAVVGVIGVSLSVIFTAYSLRRQHEEECQRIAGQFQAIQIDQCQRMHGLIRELVKVSAIHIVKNSVEEFLKTDNEEQVEAALVAAQALVDKELELLDEAFEVVFVDELSGTGCKQGTQK